MKIIFICHGNICRSPIAEYVFRHLACEKGVSDLFDVSSAGVSREEDGNDIYPPAKRVLKANGIPFSHHRAHRITDSEFSSAELAVAVDSSNLRALLRRFGNDPKIIMLLDRDVEDPWYTDDFDKAYEDIFTGCTRLLEEILASS